MPIYTLLIAAFVPNIPIIGGFLRCRPAVMLGLYVLGFLAAIAVARLLKSTILKSSGSSFVLEMPPYRWPTLHSLGLRLLDRAKVFLRRAGTVILVVAIGSLGSGASALFAWQSARSRAKLRGNDR